MLRARKARREVYPGSWLPEPLVEDSADDGPEHEAVLADSVGMALLVVLESLTPAERLSFVLHDVFAVPFDVSPASWTGPPTQPVSWRWPGPPSGAGGPAARSWR